MKNRVFFYIAVALCAVGVVFFGLSFSPLGIYALISSIVLGIASLSFCSAQKKRDNFKALKYAVAAGYILLAASVLFFVGGLIYSAIV